MSSAYLDKSAVRPQHDPDCCSYVMILQRRLVIVHDGQGVKRLDQVVVVDAQVLKIMNERWVICTTDAT